MKDPKNDSSFAPLPDIEKVKQSMGHGKPVSTPELERIMGALQAKTSLSKDMSKIILALFFEEIRSAMLKGDRVKLRGFGTFQVSSPKTTGSKKKIFPKFKVSKKFKEFLNAPGKH